MLYYQNQNRAEVNTPRSNHDSELRPNLTPRSADSRSIEEVSARLKALKERVEGLDDGSDRFISPRPVIHPINFLFPK